MSTELKNQFVLNFSSDDLNYNVELLNVYRLACRGKQFTVLGVDWMPLTIESKECHQLKSTNYEIVAIRMIKIKVGE